MRDHLIGTAEMARSFAEPFGAGDAAFAIGLLHDAGKVAQAWQERLLALEGRRTARNVDHKVLGAALSLARTGGVGAAAICGHHGGIPDVSRETIPSLVDDDLKRQLQLEVPEVDRFLAGDLLLPPRWSEVRGDDPCIFEMGTRLLHSALVDADYLDTSAHFNANPAGVRDATDFHQLATAFESARGELMGNRVSSPVDAARSEVYGACLSVASEAPGFFRLSAPTGSGKTLAAAGFAIHHAAEHGLRRVIVAVPYLTITEQNAAVYRRLLGEGVVLEHHSAVEAENLARYGVENWDAPFVVTTTVQLFESLFSNKPSKTRKLHRLVNSVIVLDEVQALPTSVLPTILDGLRILVRHFGVTVLFASATQPTVEVLRPFHDWGVAVREIVDDPPSLYRSMRRITTEWTRVETRQAFGESVRAERQSLVVLNTTADARDVARDLAGSGGGNVLHLSTRMCQAHRRQVLDEVQALLVRGEDITLVSTQLIEAGVDVDFPIVFRAVAPAESLLQAAGRVNREGRQQSGRLVVVDCPELGTLRAYATGIAKTRAEFEFGAHDLDNPDAMERYYRSLFAVLDPDAQRDSVNLLHARKALHFRTVAQDFRMIDDDTRSVVVSFDDAARVLVEAMQTRLAGNGTPTRDDFRALQPYIVSLPARLAGAPAVVPYINEFLPGLGVWVGPYDALVGLDLSDQPKDTVW